MSETLSSVGGPDTFGSFQEAGTWFVRCEEVSVLRSTHELTEWTIRVSKSPKGNSELGTKLEGRGVVTISIVLIGQFGQYFPLQIAHLAA